MKDIYNDIKRDIKGHPEVQASILGKVDSWKRSQFVILAEIISDHLYGSPLLDEVRRKTLGTTLSPITLQRFFDNDYQFKTHNDLRFIKTLDKLCIFLGENDLNSYIRNIFNRRTETQPAEIIVETTSFERDLIFNFCQSQFQSLMDLPSIRVDKIEEYVYENSPLSARCRIFIEDQYKNNLTFITENNRSNFEIFEVSKISDEEDLKVIKTQEFWNLLFRDIHNQQYIINHLNTQYYFIRKINDDWKIWDNYNPDYGKILKIN